MTRAQLITSRKNPWFRRFRDAVEHHREEIALEGPKAIHDAMRLGWKPIAIATAGPNSAIPEMGHTITLDQRLFREIGDTVTSQGVVALFERPATPLEELFTGKVVVVLDSVQDPGNVGTIIRLAAAFDAGGVALTEGCADAFGSKAIRASVGTVLNVPIAKTTRRELLETIQQQRYELWVTAAGDHEVTISSHRVAIAFGSEGQGVSGDLAQHAKSLSIPMSDRVESLNVAAAAAIVLSKLFEARRRGTLSAPRSRK